MTRGSTSYKATIKKMRYWNTFQKRFPFINFFQHFKGQFREKSYDSATPPKMRLENSKICDKFDNFISSTVLERVANGSLVIWGKEECEPYIFSCPSQLNLQNPECAMTNDFSVCG